MKQKQTNETSVVTTEVICQLILVGQNVQNILLIQSHILLDLLRNKHIYLADTNDRDYRVFTNDRSGVKTLA